MALWLSRFIYSVGAKGGVRPSVYGEDVLDHPLVWLWCDILGMGQTFPKVGGEE